MYIVGFANKDRFKTMCADEHEVFRLIQNEQYWQARHCKDKRNIVTTIEYIDGNGNRVDVTKIFRFFTNLK